MSESVFHSPLTIYFFKCFNWFGGHMSIPGAPQRGRKSTDILRGRSGASTQCGSAADQGGEQQHLALAVVCGSGGLLARTEHPGT